MKKLSTKPDTTDTTVKNANLKGDRLTSKHGKATAHKVPAKRMASKVRGR